MGISVPTAELIGTILEVLGYGAYLVVAPRALLVIHSKKLRRGLGIYLHTTVVLIFCLITLHLVADLTRAFIAFTAHTSTPKAPEMYYANVDTTLTLTKNGSVVCTTLVADALLIYRTLVVWGGKWWVLVLPVTLYFLDIATSIWFTWSITEARPGRNVLGTTAFSRSIYFFAATLAVNLVCTCLIAYRLWIVQRAIVGYVTGIRRVRNVLVIVLESAAIYTIDLVCMIILVGMDSAVVFFFLNSMPPLIGLVFTFVVLRSSSVDHDHRYEGATSFGVQSSSVPQSAKSNGRMSLPVSQSSSDCEGVRVHLERVVHHDCADRMDVEKAP